MVRLKHEEVDELEGFNAEFQSHNGSIKTCNRGFGIFHTGFISIPQWFD